MSNNLLFDFTVDKAAKTVYITREFDADLDLVWEAFTNMELLDQWTAPAPMRAKTKHMNFEVGGRRFYAMIGPDGQERWALQRYTSITPKTNFKIYNCFSDKDENPELPGSDWDYNFSEETARPDDMVGRVRPDDGNGRTITKVNITIFNESLERMERVMDGFKIGFTMTLKNLEELLADLSKKS